MRASRLLELLDLAIAELEACGVNATQDCLTIAGCYCDEVPFELRPTLALGDDRWLFALNLPEAKLLKDALADPKHPLQNVDFEIERRTSKKTLATKSLVSQKERLRQLASPEHHGRRPLPHAKQVRP